MKRLLLLGLATVGITACVDAPKDVATNPAVASEKRDPESWTHEIHENAERMIREGREIFRHDTFGSEAFWGQTLRLHEAIAACVERCSGLSLVVPLSVRHLRRMVQTRSSYNRCDRLVVTPDGYDASSPGTRGSIVRR